MQNWYNGLVNNPQHELCASGIKLVLAVLNLLQNDLHSLVMVWHRTVQQLHTKIWDREVLIVPDIRVDSATCQRVYQETITISQTRRVCLTTSVVANYLMKAITQPKQITYMVKHMDQLSLLSNWSISDRTLSVTTKQSKLWWVILTMTSRLPKMTIFNWASISRIVMLKNSLHIRQLIRLTPLSRFNYQPGQEISVGREANSIQWEAPIKTVMISKMSRGDTKIIKATLGIVVKISALFTTATLM